MDDVHETAGLVARLRSYRTHLGELSSLSIHPEAPGLSTGGVISVTSQAASEIERLLGWIDAAIGDFERNQPGQAYVCLLNAKEGLS